MSRLVGAKKQTGTSGFQGISRSQVAAVPKMQPSLVTVTSIPAGSATSIKTASTSGTVISSSMVSKIVTGLQAFVVGGLIYIISDARPKTGPSSSDGCPDTAVPLCRNPQGVAIFRSLLPSIVQDEASLLTVCTIQIGTV